LKIDQMLRHAKVLGYQDFILWRGVPEKTCFELNLRL